MDWEHWHYRQRRNTKLVCHIPYIWNSLIKGVNYLLQWFLTFYPLFFLFLLLSFFGLFFSRINMILQHFHSWSLDFWCGSDIIHPSSTPLVNKWFSHLPHLQTSLVNSPLQPHQTYLKHLRFADYNDTKHCSSWRNLSTKIANGIIPAREEI